MGVRQYNTQVGSPLRRGTFGDNHDVWMIPSWIHSTTGISTQVVDLAFGTAAINLAATAGTNVILEGTSLFMPFPMTCGMATSAAAGTLTAVVVGLDSLGVGATETLTHPASGTAVNGKVLWSRIDSITITANALAATTATFGTLYRAAVNLTGIVPLPIPFIPLRFTDVNGLQNTLDLRRIWALQPGGGVWVAASQIATPTTGVPTGASQMFLPNANTYSTVATTTGTSVFTATGGTYGCEQALVMTPNVSVPANVTAAPLWALTTRADSLLNQH